MTHPSDISQRAAAVEEWGGNEGINWWEWERRAGREGDCREACVSDGQVAVDHIMTAF